MCAFSISNFLTLIFSACLVVAGFLTFLAICAQVWIYNCQLKEMQKSTNAATKSAKAAEDSVTLARENAHLDQRAWIGAEYIGFPQAGKIFSPVVGKYW